MFSQQERSDVLRRLVAIARTDDAISAAAVVGSAALDRTDEWSDIDLALCLARGLEPADVASAWTDRMYEDYGAVDHLDMWAGGTLFRVFLLSSSLQVDLSFWGSDRFAPSGESFRLLFGEANEPAVAPPAMPGTLIGMGWLYALHARSSIARGRSLQALHMVNGVRDHVVSLACLRYELPFHHGRGADALPAEVRDMLTETVVRGLDRSELSRAFARAITALLDEAERVDSDLATRLGDPFSELVRTATERPKLVAEQPEDAGQ